MQPSIADESQKIKKIEPLSEAFLMFLAEMEQVDGEFLHPVDIANVIDKEKNKKQNTKLQTLDRLKEKTTEKGKGEEDDIE